tara:strand:- start:55 stop:249 length:195 start_codon:yes stop_codon:yes gene_type:complete
MVTTWCELVSKRAPALPELILAALNDDFTRTLQLPNVQPLQKTNNTINNQKNFIGTKLFAPSRG